MTVDQFVDNTVSAFRRAFDLKIPICRETAAQALVQYFKDHRLPLTFVQAYNLLNPKMS